MCKRPQLIGAMLLCGLPFTAANAYEALGLFPESVPMQQCYGEAMVGMDSVINARLGVLPESGVELARLGSIGFARDMLFSTDLLRTIFNAYLWDGTPHSYAVSVFYQCAQRGVPLHHASTD